MSSWYVKGRGRCMCTASSGPGQAPILALFPFPMSLFFFPQQFEPVVQPGNEGVVHHIVLNFCHGEIDDSDHGLSWDCLDEYMPEYNQCIDSVLVWAVGGNVGFDSVKFLSLFLHVHARNLDVHQNNWFFLQAFYFPEHTGLPFFTTTEPTFMRLEMHYDNPAHIEGKSNCFLQWSIIRPEIMKDKAIAKLHFQEFRTTLAYGCTWRQRSESMTSDCWTLVCSRAPVWWFLLTSATSKYAPHVCPTALNRSVTRHLS